MMRVAVCCKGVPVDPALESVQITNGDIQYIGTDFSINEFDAYALQAALTLKDRFEAETIAVSLGPLRVQEVLHFALAKGIDRVYRVDGQTTRPEKITAGLVPVLKEIDPRIVLVGVQSEDWMGGEVGVYLSQALEMSLAYAVMGIGELTDTHICVKKELGGGRMAEVLLKLPALLCVQSGIQPLHYLSTGKLRKARKITIPLGGSLGEDNTAHGVPGLAAYEIKAASHPSREGHAEMISGDRKETAAALLQIVKKAI